MKLGVDEAERCFGIDLSAETLAEGVLLARLGTNATNRIVGFYTLANSDGTMNFSVVFAKHRRAAAGLPRRR